MSEPLRNGRSALEKILDEHEVRIGTLADRVGAVEHKADLIISAVADLKTAFAASQARAPTITFGNLLSYTRDVAILIGLCVGAMVWVNNAASSAENSVTKYRLEQIERGHSQTWKDKP